MQFLISKLMLIVIIVIHLNGCSYFISQAKQDFGKQLTFAMLNHNDPQTIAEAIPAYLLLLESLIAGEPENKELLASSSHLYASYISLLPSDSERRKLLSIKALNYAFRSACAHDQSLCLLDEQKFEQFDRLIKQTNSADIDTLNTLGVAWAVWIQAHSSDWNAIAQLAQVKAIMSRVVELDYQYKNGNAHIYLGVLATILPPALGGVPEIAKQHFETAIKLSEDKNLMIKVLYAKQYARMMFDRELHDNLLNTVINAKLEQTNFTLMNALAKKQAQNLLNSADEYF